MRRMYSGQQSYLRQALEIVEGIRLKFHQTLFKGLSDTESGM